MSEKPYWEGKEYSFVCHKECEYFPCHKTNDPDNFNCLFCYCPLYALGDACGGNFRFTEKGIKDCTNCLLPHVRKNYGYVTGKYSEIMEVAGKNRKENRELIQETAEELKTLTEGTGGETCGCQRSGCVWKMIRIPLKGGVKIC